MPTDSFVNTKVVKSNIKKPTSEKKTIAKKEKAKNNHDMYRSIASRWHDDAMIEKSIVKM